MSPLQKKRPLLHAKLVEALEEFEYRFQRYQIKYSIGLGYTLESIDMSSLQERIRKTDRYLMLDENIYAVIFDCTDEEKGIKAADNLLTFFQHTYFSKSVFASVITADGYSDVNQMVSKLFDLLNYAIRHNMDNHVIDISQVMKSI